MNPRSGTGHTDVTDAATGVRLTVADGIAVWSMAIPAVESRHERRKAERMAVDRLVAAAFGPHAHLGHEPSGAPYIYFDDDTLCDASETPRGISISHCADTAMLAVAPESVAIGIDCEYFRPALRNVASRVLSPAEQAEWGDDDTMLLRAWTIKEAVYKAASTPGLPLAEGISLPSPDTGKRPTARTADGRLFRLIFLQGFAPAVTLAVGQV